MKTDNVPGLLIIPFAVAYFIVVVVWLVAIVAAWAMFGKKTASRVIDWKLV